MLPLPFLPYEGGPTIIEWLNQICQKFNELLTAVKNVRELPPGGTHGQVATPKEDGSGYEWVNQSGGGGGSDDLWYPTVTTAGVISWAKSSTTTPPTSRNIKGPKGNDGTPGAPGKDGVSPTANVVQTETGATITVTDASGTTTAKIKNGTPGADGAPGTPGAPGAPGKDGVSPTANVVQTETGATITVTDASGTTTAKIKNGTPGADGAPGTPGAPGAPGKDGITPTFEVGTVTKLSPDAEPTVTLENVGGGLYMIDYGIPQGQPGTPGAGSGGVEWVEVTLSEPSVYLNIDNLKLWYDKNDHQHLKFEGYIWAPNGDSSNLHITMPDDFSAVVSDMWVPLLALAGTDTSNLITVALYVKYDVLHRLTIYPTGTRNTYWLDNRRYAVGSEIYLNPSQLILSNSDEVNDDIDINTGDDAGTQHGE